jgi:small-conductance mechanosensitive channel
MASLARILFLAIVAGALWLSYDFASAYQMFSASLIAPAIGAAATVATAVLIVILAGQFSLRFGVARLTRTDPTGLHRGLVFAVLGFAAAAAVLAHLGFDLTTILTTSALVTAFVGLALQPMLGSVLSGLAIDRFIRVGDAVLLNGEDIEITSLNWRSAVGRRDDGGTVIVPNALLAGTTLTVLPHDVPAGAQIGLQMPSSTPPDRVRAILQTILDDVPEVDTRRSIILHPETAGGTGNSTGYRVTFWVRNYRRRSQVKAEILTRLWYALRREQLVSSSDSPEARGAAELFELVSAALNAAAARHPNSTGLHNDAREMLQSGEILRFGDDERIVLPLYLAGRSCLLIDGSIAQSTPSLDTPRQVRPSREESLGRIERSLAWHIGPYAEVAVRRAAMNRATLLEICDMVAEEIDDLDARQAFLHNIDVPRDIVLGPGFLFQTGIGGTGGTELSQLRAVGYALLLVLPDGILSATG